MRHTRVQTRTLNQHWLENNQKVILENIPKRYPVLYLAYTEETGKYIKFGQSRNLHERYKTHNNAHDFFYIFKVFHTLINFKLEKKIKECNSDPQSIFYGRIVSREYNGRKRVELINMHDPTILRLEDLLDEITKMETNISHEISCEEMVQELAEENQQLKSELDEKSSNKSWFSFWNKKKT